VEESWKGSEAATDNVATKSSQKTTLCAFLSFISNISFFFKMTFNTQFTGE